MELTVLDNKGAKKKSLQVDERLANLKGTKAVLHEAIVAYNANQRQGTHNTKGRAEVTGGGKKPWRQKGTGRARAGSIRSPLWRKGGIIFGPKPRSYRQELPKKKRRIAFALAFNELLKAGRVQIVEPIKLKEPKTKLAAAVIEKWKVPFGAILAVTKVDPDLNKATRNLPSIEVTTIESLNTYDLLRARNLLLTEESFNQLQDRIFAGLTKKSEESK